MKNEQGIYSPGTRPVKDFDFAAVVSLRMLCPSVDVPDEVVLQRISDYTRGFVSGTL